MRDTRYGMRGCVGVWVLYLVRLWSLLQYLHIITIGWHWEYAANSTIACVFFDLKLVTFLDGGLVERSDGDNAK